MPLDRMCGWSHPVYTPKRISRRLKKMHTDVWNSYKISNIENNRYFVFIIDDLTRKFWIVLMKSKTQMSEKIREWHVFVNLKTEKKATIFRTDNVKKYQKFEKLMNSQNVKTEFTTTYIFEKNGVVEKFNKTIVQMTRSMFIWTKLFHRFWKKNCMHRQLFAKFDIDRNESKKILRWIMKRLFVKY